MPRLTPTERAVLAALASAEPPRRTAERLGVETNAIYVMRCRVYAKLGLTLDNGRQARQHQAILLFLTGAALQ